MREGIECKNLLEFYGLDFCSPEKTIYVFCAGNEGVIYYSRAVGTRTVHTYIILYI